MKEFKHHPLTAGIFAISIILSGCNKKEQSTTAEDNNLSNTVNTIGEKESDAEKQTSPDLELFNLKGPVKSLQYNTDTSIPLLTNYDEVIEFDRQGECKNILDYFYDPSLSEPINVKRNVKGQLIKLTNPEDIISYTQPGNYELNWNGEKLYKISYNGWESHETYTISYNNEMISNIEFFNSDDGGEAETLLNFYDYQFDKFGNWTECKVNYSGSRWDNYAEGEDPVKEEAESGTATIKRTITYY